VLLVLRHWLLPLHNMHLHVPRQKNLLLILPFAPYRVELRSRHQVVLHGDRSVSRSHHRLVVVDPRGSVVADSARR
jgi:hypothetical protein